MDKEKALLRTGDIINGAYTVESKISAGSSGQVYLVSAVGSTKKYALKIIPHTNDDTKKELEIMSQFSLNKNIIRIYDFGNLNIEGVVSTYLVMDYYGRGTINDLVSDKEYPILSNEELYYYLDQTLEGLKGLHYTTGNTPKIIHKDVKPANILVNDSKDAFLSDFGISLLERQLGDNNSIKGTARFMAPETRFEQKKSDLLKAGYAGDIFALGMIFYRYATGVYPMEDYEIDVKNPNDASLKEKNTSLISLNVWEDIPEPKFFNEQISEGLNLIISKMLVKDWNKRYQSVIDIKDDLDNYELKDKLPRINISSLNEIPLTSPFKDEERKHYVYRFNKFLKTFSWKWSLGIVLVLIVLTIAMLGAIFL